MICKDRRYNKQPVSCTLVVISVASIAVVCFMVPSLGVGLIIAAIGLVITW
jgi:hypothetical protein